MTANGSFDTTHLAPWTPQWLMGQHINNTDTTLSGGVVPADMGFLAYNFDPSLGTTTSTPLTTAGTVYVCKLHTNVDITVTNLHTYLVTANGTPTTAQNFAALFSSAKAFQAATADQSTAWGGSAGFLTMALTAAQAVPAGYFYVAFYSNGTTQPAFMRAATGYGNGLLSAANSRWASADTGRTTAMPTTLGTFTATAVPYWVGVS